MIIHLFLAIGFADPFFPSLGPWLGTALLGTFLAAIPVLIHLLNKSRFIQLEWAAMTFLMAAVRKNARRVRLQQLILLITRVLLILLVISALAQPYREHEGFTFQNNARHHKIIVIDSSLSMGFQSNQESSFDQARNLAIQILKESNKGDPVSILTMGSPARLVNGPSYDHSMVHNQLKTLENSYETVDLVSTLSQIEVTIKLLGNQPLLNEVYFISDLQKSNWLYENRSPNYDKEVGQLARRVDDQAAIIILDVGQTANENLGVLAVSSDNPLVTPDTPITLTGTIGNFSRKVQNPLVELWVNQQMTTRQTVSISPYEVANVRFHPTFSREGNHSVQIRIPVDQLPADNQRWMTVPVESQFEILCVNGKSAGRFFQRATSYLQTALAPQPASAFSSNPIRPIIVPESRWDEVIQNYSCIFFCNVGQFTENEFALLKQHLHEGGAIIWFLGDQVISENYNRILYRGGDGVFPVELGNRVGDADAMNQIFLFDPKEYEHDIIKPFQSEPRSGLVTAGVYSYIKSTLPPNQKSRLVLSYNNGDPAIIEQSIGKGRSIVVTTAADSTWSNWPQSNPSYVPLIHQLLHYSLEDRLQKQTTQVGIPIRLLLPNPRANQVDILTPAGISESIELSTPGVLFYPVPSLQTTVSPGIYRVQDAASNTPSSPSIAFAINHPERESDLTKLTYQELVNQVWPGIDFVYLTDWMDTDANQKVNIRHRGMLHELLIYILLALIMAESFLAWKFGPSNR